MRMWLADPKTMCRQHLLGEHVEMHMFHGSMAKGTNMEGYLRRHLVNLPEIKLRHDAIVDEMIVRGYLHMTPMAQNPYVSSVQYPMPNSIRGCDVMELYRRCDSCRAMLPKLVKETTPDRPHQCPVCNGAGGSELRWSYTTQKWYMFLVCHQCNGYGWLKEPPTCIHTYAESFGVDVVGCNVLIMTCTKCGDTHNHDTSG